MSTEQKNAWVERVLGIALAEAPSGARGNGPAKSWEAGKAAWQRESESADRQIASLAARLRADPDPEMQAIADMGLNALTEGHKVKLLAAMMDVDRAGGAPEAARKLEAAIDSFGAHLGSDPRIAACDRCPDLDIAVVATLTRGLDALRAGVAGIVAEPRIQERAA